MLIDVEQGRLNPAIAPRNRQMIDPTAAARADGTIVARAITGEEAHRRFGRREARGW